MSPAREPDPIEVRLFLEAIHQRWGYDLRDYAAASMRRRVLAALADTGAPHLGDLQHRVIHDREVFADVLDSLTVRVTELFRDPPVYAVLRERVAPVLRTYPLLKIWHAGCATGEEAYAMAILLHEEELADRTQIYATDLSQRAIDHAKEGVYPARQLAAFTENHRAAGGHADLGAWVTAAYDHIAMRESLRRRILFFQHDLVNDQAFGEMHLVACRNVLIYFGAELRQRVLEKIAASLVPGGFLCLGTSERLKASPIEDRFSPFCPQACIYRYEP